MSLAHLRRAFVAAGIERTARGAAACGWQASPPACGLGTTAAAAGEGPAHEPRCSICAAADLLSSSHPAGLLPPAPAALGLGCRTPRLRQTAAPTAVDAHHRRHYTTAPPQPPPRTPRYSIGHPVTPDSPAPGERLRLAVRTEDEAAAAPAAGVPPWQDSPQEELSQMLQDYRQEISTARPEALSQLSSEKPSLPFLEEAVGSVRLERQLLSGHGRLSFAARRLARAPRAARAPPHLPAHAHRSPGEQQQAAAVAEANRVISLLAAVESRLPLQPWQRRAVARGLAAGAPPPPPPGPRAAAQARPHHPPAAPPAAPTPQSASAMVAFLLRACCLSEGAAAAALAARPQLLGLDPGAAGPVIDCLRLLELSDGQVARLVAARPGVLAADAEAHVLPLADYLSAVGFLPQESAALLEGLPGGIGPGSRGAVAGAVAFWVGRGVGRRAVAALLAAAPQLVGTRLALLQLKVEWLEEEAGLGVHAAAALPQALTLPLLAATGPRLAFARHLGACLAAPPPAEDAGGGGGGEEADPGGLPAAALLGEEADFLAALGADGAAFDAFAARWRREALPRWLAGRGAQGLDHYHSLHWLRQAEAEALRARHDRHVGLRQVAWGQQRLREKAWRATWVEWRARQERHEQELQRTRRMEQRRDDREARLAAEGEAEDAEERAAAALAPGAGPPPPAMCARGPLCSKRAGHPGRCDSLREHVRLQLEAVTQGRAAAAARARPAEPAPPPLHPPPSLEGLPAVPRPDEDTQDPPRVRACAASIQELLEAAPHGAASTEDVNSWAARRGYGRACVRAAKGLLTATGVAAPTPIVGVSNDAFNERPWTLASAPRSSLPSSARAVRALAAQLAAALAAAPGGALFKSDLAARTQAWGYSPHRLQPALMLLREQGAVTWRGRPGASKRRGPSPKEVVLLDGAQYADGGAAAGAGAEAGPGAE